MGFAALASREEQYRRALATFPVKRGELWAIPSRACPGQEHRILCGHGGRQRNLERLAQGEPVRLVVTDPPFCAGGNQEATKGGGTFGLISSDNLSTRGWRALLTAALDVVEPEAVYAFTSWRLWAELQDLVEVAGIAARGMIVWDKGTPGQGQAWPGQHELILFASTIDAGKPDRKVRAPGNLVTFTPGSIPRELLAEACRAIVAASAAGKTPDELADQLAELLTLAAGGYVITCPRTGNKRHWTEKPPALLAEVLAGDEVTKRGRCPAWDLFAGSFPLLDACEMTGRVARGLERLPMFVAASLQRAVDLGLEPYLVSA